ncbi:hypothetical protein EK904_012088, partial [Melospiza melodia maxima]
ELACRATSVLQAGKLPTENGAVAFDGEQTVSPRAGTVQRAQLWNGLFPAVWSATRAHFHPPEHGAPAGLSPHSQHCTDGTHRGATGCGAGGRAAENRLRVCVCACAHFSLPVPPAPEPGGQSGPVLPPPPPARAAPAGPGPPLT